MLKLKVGATAVFITILFLFVPASAARGQVAPAVELEGENSSDLFVSVSDRPRKPVFVEEAVVQARYAAVNWPLLQENPQQIRLNLFADEVLTAVLLRREQNHSGSTTWIGQVAGVEQSSVILVSHRGTLQGMISQPGAVYRIKYLEGALHQIARIDQSVYEDHEAEVPERGPQPGFRRSLTAVASDDGSVIDLMVVYTAAMRAANGGTAAVEAQIDLAVAEANIAYNNSGVGQAVHLVHAAEVTYTESGSSSTDLTRLQGTSDGHMDDVHTWRNTYHADFVLLVTNGGGCGLGYLQSSAPDPSFQSAAFSQANAGCLTGNYTLPHEVGHNMGLRHDWYVDASVTPAAHAHGFAYVAGSWRTVMAYNNLCADSGGSCTRLLYFSNPSINYNGNPTGVPAGTASNCVENALSPNPASCDAHNAAILNAGRVTNSQFRSSQITWLGNSTDWNSASNWRIYEGPLSGQTAVNRIPRAIDNVFIPTSPSGGNFPTLSSGTVAVRDLTIATGATLNMSGGTLTVYGHWEEQGTGTFNGSGGTVTFAGIYGDQAVTSNAASIFPNVQIGDGGSTTVNLGGNVDINGNVLIKSGATFNASSYTVEVSGNWEDEGNGFAAGTSTVILDGVDQTLDKVTTQAVFSENFDQYMDSCTSGVPSGWRRETISAGFGFAQCSQGGQSPSANRWSDTTDAWLHSLAVSLQPNITYQLSYKQRSGSSSSQQDWNVHLGTTQSAAGMTTLVDSATNVTNSSFVTETGSFTVATSGTYYLGFHNTRDTGSSYGSLDDVVLTAVQNLTFYNLTIANSGTATFNQNATVLNNLVVNSGATADFGNNDTTMEGSVTNNGTMQQSRNVSDGSGATTYEFLILKNAAGSSTKYYGVTIKPDGGQALGQTSVAVSGNQACTTNGSDPVLDRCYNITPTTAQSATIRYWYTNAELNGQTWNDLKLWDWHSSTWTELAAGNDTYGSGCGSDVGCWGQWTGVATFSPMVLGTTTAPAGSPAGTCSAPTAPTTMGLNTAGTQLTWSGGTADSYQVWRATNTPYFTPGASCASPGGLTCTANATSPLATSASTVGTNYYYKIVAVNTCGSTATATGHKGAFSFGITPGTP
ncbi:MAG: hypothetical protein H6668_12650 [Ardenticatenaceae bacterium]|nr:hypothetical protein [Ardenticatenaceae bacterium]